MGIQYNPRAVTDGLVLCLDAANPKSYPGSGTIWSDLSGNGNNATISNGSYDSANGGSIAFNGTTTGAYFTVIANSGDFTCEIWAKQTSANYGSAMMFGGSNGITGADNCQLIVFGGDGSIGLALGNNPVSVSPANASSATSVNNWYQVIYSRSGSTINIYANGVFKSSGTSATQLRIDRLGNIGGINGSLGKWLLGNISNAKVYNRALSASEVLQNFNALRGRYGI